MGTILHGIKNFLQLINDNWPLIIAILGLAFGLFKKIYGFFTKSEEERIESEKFWKTHALIYNEDLIDKERTKI